jgi:hypothetical protein
MNNGFSSSGNNLLVDNEIANGLTKWSHTCVLEGDESSKLTCFSFLITSTDLENIWQSITNEVAMNYIAHLENGFSKWNCYIVFLCSSEISKDLKYKIENDKFAARKILLEGISETISEDEITKIINDRVLDFNIELPEVSQANSRDIELSDISQNLLSRELLLDKKEDSIIKRQEWINTELKRIMSNEN